MEKESHTLEFSPAPDAEVALLPSWLDWKRKSKKLIQTIRLKGEQRTKSLDEKVREVPWTN